MSRARSLIILCCLAGCAPPEALQLTLSGVPADAAALELRLLQGAQERVLTSADGAQPPLDLSKVAPQKRTVTVALSPLAAMESGQLLAQVYRADECLIASGAADWPGAREVKLQGVSSCPAKRGQPTPVLVQQVTPAHIAATGGATVTIRGTGFRADSEVFFDGQPAASREWISSTELRAIAPARRRERLNGTLMVRNADGQKDQHPISYAEDRVCFELQQTLAKSDESLRFGTLTGPLPAPVDVTGDGYPDLIYAAGNGFSLVPSDGKGLLKTGASDQPIYTTPTNIYHLGGVDVDRNGKPALVTLEYTAGSMTNAPTRTLAIWSDLGGPKPFEKAQVARTPIPQAADTPGAGSPAGQVSPPLIGDMDGDGRPDLVLGFEGNSATTRGAIRVLLNQDGRFPASVGDRPSCYVPPWATLTALADVDGDGMLDAVFGVANAFTLTDTLGVQLLRGTQCRGWLELSVKDVVPMPREVRRAVAGDFDGDGKVDLSGDAQSPAIPLLRNAGNATFPPRLQGVLTDSAPTGGNAGGLIAGDLNGDGRDDLVSARTFSFLLTQPEGKGVEVAKLGTCTPPSQSPAPVDGNVAAIADMDNDGRPDVIIAFVGASPTIRIYRNRPAP